MSLELYNNNNILSDVMINYSQIYFNVFITIVCIYIVFKLNKISYAYNNIHKNITELTVESYKNKIRHINNIIKLDDRSAKKITLIKNEL